MTTTEECNAQEEKGQVRPVRRYIDRTKAKKNNDEQGTFDIQRLVSTDRAEVDLSSSSSSSSSLVSFPSDNESSVLPSTARESFAQPSSRAVPSLIAPIAEIPTK